MKGAGSIVSIDDNASVEDLTLGLDWTQWLLRSVRQRCAGVVLPEQDSLAALRKEWPLWLGRQFRQQLGPALLAGADAAHQSTVESLQAGEMRWLSCLSNEEAARSEKAGRQLLSSMKGARHAGPLALLQEAHSSGSVRAHIGLVWPVVAHVFQLSPGIMLAEYLRLELQCAGRRLPGLQEDSLFTEPMVQCVQELLSGQNLAWRDNQAAVDARV